MEKVRRRRMLIGEKSGLQCVCTYMNFAQYKDISTFANCFFVGCCNHDVRRMVAGALPPRQARRKLPQKPRSQFIAGEVDGRLIVAKLKHPLPLLFQLILKGTHDFRSVVEEEGRSL